MSHTITIIGNVGNDAQMVKTTSAVARTLVKFSVADNPRGYRDRQGVYQTGGDVQWRQCTVGGAMATETLRAQLTKGRRLTVTGVLSPIVVKMMKNAEGLEVPRAFQDVIVTSVSFAPELPPRADSSAPPSTEDESHESDDSDDLPL